MIQDRVFVKIDTSARGWKGLSKGMHPSDFDPVQLRKGTVVEMEHVRNSSVAKRIAMDHLTEDPLYYKKLARFHSSVSEDSAKRTKRPSRSRLASRRALKIKVLQIPRIKKPRFIKSITGIKFPIIYLGGGCLISTLRRRSTSRYLCDDSYMNKDYNFEFSTTMNAHFNMPSSIKNLAQLKKLMKEPGVKYLGKWKQYT